jgi:hypothetical protein
MGPKSSSRITYERCAGRVCAFAGQFEIKSVVGRGFHNANHALTVVGCAIAI